MRFQADTAPGLLTPNAVQSSSKRTSPPSALLHMGGVGLSWREAPWAIRSVSVEAKAHSALFGVNAGGSGLPVDLAGLRVECAQEPPLTD